MDLHCERALELLPRYADGELTEGQAAPLRQHLLDCPACRAVASRQRGLGRWFEAVAPVAVPPGFAERVAAMAFEGAQAQREPQREPEPAGGAWDHRLRAVPDQDAAPLEVGLGLRDFLLLVTAAAAVALFALSVAIGLRDRPSGETLSATEIPELLKMLDSNVAPAAATTDGTSPIGGAASPIEGPERGR
ncbi:hypothetical protein Pla86_50680 [Planctomycetes bacterium Pla86]|uniref:Putative zinc-finger domain-containing protein n=2 Tax=Engelhardtia mirabilis TaxID=2528011 RepID=A0A518BSK6_9BACT|nr:hypothetical protein Pla133_50710 [Planctomycetes bacterium Pla133]QDV04273.1 hypothetical protein Pla86_50680 [Planctomycetes bacterium Pla86]